MDTGWQRSYILKDTAKELGYVPFKTVTITHALFGGQKTEEKSHNCYKIRIGDNNYNCTMEMLDQNHICSSIQPIHFGEWIEELKAKNIHLSDVGSQGPIEVLLGADVNGKLYTGRRHLLKSGLVAVDTLLGWTLMGKVPNAERSTNLVSMSMLVKDAPISNLWALDVLGITDPAETKNRQELALAAKEMFQQTVRVNEMGRYEVRLPWLEGHAPLSRNYYVARRRLHSTTKKLKRNHILESYDHVFQEWLQEGIIEEVPNNELGNEAAHYLPHRAVIKENSTTKIRPVFDASSCEKGKPSLNSCLETGPNLIESIPSILLRFRLKKSNRTGTFYSPETIDKLSESFYVDNCVTSLEDEASLNRFISESIAVMNEGSFDLRGWEYTQGKDASTEVEPIYVLGLSWYPNNDVLAITKNCIEASSGDRTITKRQILSMAQKVFDPIGFTCPTSLYPKLLLQKTWKQKLDWDDPVDEELKHDFCAWNKELDLLTSIRIPRCIKWGLGNNRRFSLHVLCDASKDAYAAVIYLRIKNPDRVYVNLLTAKARVAPLKKTTIPRLELLAATIGARLFHSVRAEFKRDMECYFCEYLGQLKLANNKAPSRPIFLNEVILVGNDKTKRLDWPLGRVIELITGRDGKIRLVRLQTACGQLIRTIQRLYSLEVIDQEIPANQKYEEASASAGVKTKSRVPENISRESAGVKSKVLRSDKDESIKLKFSRSGRILRPPKRFP
ncbi:uncharacterized protein LOC108911929 [Anoplophora glabripennis]|uniref:uncharacterized protein LOC108911929 n=1 Tax=Anoplophora glabripennis TaxID=217634 RepID=UPI000873DADF|nr:uncharacterized protein LOC108911929 [Anoplophora glabripennis]